MTKPMNRHPLLTRLEIISGASRTRGFWEDFQKDQCLAT
jgi:hypothetical protein